MDTQERVGAGSAEGIPSRREGNGRVQIQGGMEGL